MNTSFTIRADEVRYVMVKGEFLHVYFCGCDEPLTVSWPNHEEAQAAHLKLRSIMKVPTFTSDPKVAP